MTGREGGVGNEGEKKKRAGGVRLSDRVSTCLLGLSNTGTRKIQKKEVHVKRNH